MDIKTRLEDDKVLFADFNNMTSRTNVLASLNKIGIYTVEDLINAEASMFPASSRKAYVAMAHVFRNAYLNQDLVYDVLFQKEYEIEKMSNELCNDILRLGLDKGTTHEIKRRLFRVLEDYNNPTVTIEFLMREKGLNALGPNLRRYYLSYVDKKKELEQPNNTQENSDIITKENDSSTLHTLKIQLETLIGMKQGLEQQIETLQTQIATLEGGSINHGRK